jgi:hypothetical protein
MLRDFVVYDRSGDMVKKKCIYARNCFGRNHVNLCCIMEPLLQCIFNLTVEKILRVKLLLHDLLSKREKKCKTSLEIWKFPAVITCKEIKHVTRHVQVGGIRMLQPCVYIIILPCSHHQTRVIR